MLGGVIGDRTVSLLERGLDVASARHRAISNNIANANTPGYRRRDVAFEAVMRRAVEGRDWAHGDEQVEAQQVVTVDGRTVQRNDGNNVDIDYEATLLAENAILYYAMARQMSARLALMRTVVTEGRR